MRILFEKVFIGTGIEPVLNWFSSTALKLFNIFHVPENHTSCFSSYLEKGWEPFPAVPFSREKKSEIINDVLTAKLSFN